ncbi:MAG TPA: MFS transporter [Streptosporangiaceae bacterium]|jgi:hypothetical protein
MPHPLRDRHFRLYVAGRALSLAGDGAVPGALALAVIAATGSTTALAVTLGCAMVPRLLLLPLGGVIADRFDARKVAITTDIASCVAQLSVGIELLGGEPRLWQIAVAQVVGGASAAFAAPTTSPLITGTVPPEGRQRANALLGTVRGATQLAGPLLAGTFVLTVGPGWTFVLDAATFAASGVLLTVMRAARVRIPRRSLRADLAEGWAEVRARDWYWSSLIAHAVWNGAAAVLVTLGPALVVSRLGGGAVWIAILEAGAVGLVAGSLVAGRVRLTRPVLTANLCGAAYALPLALLAATAPAPLIIAAYGIAMAGLGVLNPVWETVVQATVPGSALARVTSYDWLLSLAAMPVGYVLAPLTAGFWGPSVPLAAAAVLVGAACLATAAVPGVRRLTSADAAAPAEAVRA